MNKSAVETSRYYFEIDRMVNEGLGGGLIINQYEEKRLETEKNQTKNKC